jgi:hypothetical protein
MSDFTIDVGFNTEELKSATSGMGGGTSAGGGGESGGGFGGFAKAIKAGLMATGIIGILMNLKVILEIVGFAIAAISSILGLLLVKSLEYFKNFYSDIERNSTIMAIKLNNGILSAVEWLANALRYVFTFGNQGLGTDKQFEIGRYSEEIILEGFDELRKVEQQVKEGAASFSDLLAANIAYTDSWSNAFMTKDEFAVIKQIKDESNMTFADTFGLLETAGTDLASVVEFGSANVNASADSAFMAIGSMFQSLKAKAESLEAKEKYDSKFNGLEVKSNDTKSWFDKILDFGSSTQKTQRDIRNSGSI